MILPSVGAMDCTLSYLCFLTRLICKSVKSQGSIFWLFPNGFKTCDFHQKLKNFLVELCSHCDKLDDQNLRLALLTLVSLISQLRSLLVQQCLVLVSYPLLVLVRPCVLRSLYIWYPSQTL